MITITQSGNFNKTEAALKKMLEPNVLTILHKYGKMGVSALSNATPVATSRAATSWGYTVEGGKAGYSITWTNSDIENGFPVVIMLQYGHGTGTGGYVQGQDFINPALRPIMDKLADEVWKAVTSA